MLEKGTPFIKTSDESVGITAEAFIAYCERLEQERQAYNKWLETLQVGNSVTYIHTVVDRMYQGEITALEAMILISQSATGEIPSTIASPEFTAIVIQIDASQGSDQLKLTIQVDLGQGTKIIELRDAGDIYKHIKAVETITTGLVLD